MKEFRIININLCTKKRFKKFFEYLADEVGMGLVDLISEFFYYEDFVIKTYEDDETQETFNEDFDEFFLGNYNITYVDGWDRCGDMKIREAVLISEEINLDAFLSELKELEKEFEPLHKKYCEIFDTRNSEDLKAFDFDKFNEIENRLKELKGIQ